MSSNNIFSVQPQDLKELSPSEAVEVFRDLLWAEAVACGIQTSLISVPGAITVKDGGIDAVVENAPTTSGQGIIWKGKTSYQIKTGKFDLRSKKSERDVLFKEHSSELKPGIKDCLEESGTLALVLFGNDSPTPSDSKIVKTLRDTLGKVNKTFKKAKIRVWRINQLKGFLNRYPGLALATKRGAPKKLYPHQAWARFDTMKPSLKFGEAQKQLTEDIRKELRRNDGPVHIAIQGEAGVGKTRLALEATACTDLRPFVIYLDSPKTLSNSDLLEYLTWGNDQANAILVVDECDPHNRAEIWNKVRNFSPRLKFVSIYNEIESISQVPQFIAPPLEEQEVIAIISEYIPAKDQARRWAEFCGGSPRVAHVVGNSLRHHPDDILRTPNTVNVWERYVTGADDPNSEAVRKRRLVLNHLALFQRFGFGAPHYDEAKSILELIQKIEMTFTEAEFLEIINNQQKRKNLQGNVTLYLSPKLFHIWLWADWWNTYGPSFSWDAINDLPGKLKDWFLDMFEYAKESKAAETVVQELLSPGGPFDDLETLNNRRAAGFFFRLAKSKPGEALGALERAIEGKSSEDLLAFSEGRRDIIYSLEILAIYKEYFQRAAHILLLLAEAENETWGNNASGVFAELFSSGYGGVATSEASPLERLPALKEALFSPSPTTQMLGLKACDYALEAEHWARTIGNQSSGFKSEPERWTPKTYGEIWDGYRAVWNLLTTNLDRFGERERQYAIEVLLKRARGLIFRTKLWESVLETIIYLSAKPYAPKRDLIQAVERILHHDQKKLPADVVHRLIDVSAKLVGNDYPSKLKRYAGMDLLEDRYNENGTESDDRQVVLVELAKQSATTPDLLIPELNWLVTTEAENGYSFGYELGKTDIANALLERISHAQRMCQSNCSLLFLSGYGRSTYERDPLTWEKYIEGLAINGISAQWIPELLWRSGSVPERLIDLLNTLVEEKRISPEHLGKFAYGTTRDHIKPETFLRWITLLMDDGTPASVGNALELFYSSQVRGKEKAESPFPSEHALRILTHPTWFQHKSKRRNQMDEYTWNEIGKTLIKRAPEKALILLGVLLEHFGSEDSIVESSFSEGIEVLGKIAEKFPREFWEQIKGKLGPPIDVRAFQLRHWLRGDLGDKQSPLPLVPPEMIWAWVDEDIQGRAWMLAGMVPKTWFKEEEGKVCLARQVLVRYGTQKNVRSELRNSFMSGTWWGPESSHFSGQKEFLLNIRKEDQDRNVRRWIDEYITDLSKYIDNARIREERGVF